MLGDKVAAFRRSLINATLLAVVSVASSFVPSAAGGVPAFPGAEGFGSDSIGGRGGRVLYVVNLYDSGPGSLRAALEAEGPRTVVFQLGGTILLKSGLAIRHPFITVAGQTAPGDGITLRNTANNDDAVIRVLTHDVIIRFIRVRPGASTSNSGSLDAIRIGGRSADTHNVVIDHCSFSWATDENVSFAGSARDISFQWNFVTEGLDCSSHAEGGGTKVPQQGDADKRRVPWEHYTSSQPLRSQS